MSSRVLLAVVAVVLASCPGRAEQQADAEAGAARSSTPPASAPLASSPHHCSLMVPTGFLPHLAAVGKAPGGKVVTALVLASDLRSNGEEVAQLQVLAVLAGVAQVDATVDGHWLSRDEPAAAAPALGSAARVGLYFLADDPEGGQRILERIDLGAEENSGTQALVQALLASDAPAARAAALVNAIATGGSETRHRASCDLESDARQVALLSADALATLRAYLRSADPDDAALPILLGVYAVSAASDRVPVALETLTGPRGERTMDRLRHLLRTQEFGLTATDLDPLLDGAQEVGLRRRATHLLARLAGDAARERLLALAGDADPDVASEALVGLAGRAPSEIVDWCRDRVMSQLDTGPRVEATPIQKVLLARDLQQLRSSPYTGERFGLMAAGFVLARADKPEREWLASRLPALRDESVALFLRNVLATPWADFEAAW